MKVAIVFSRILFIIISTITVTGCLDSSKYILPKDEYDNFSGYYDKTVGQKSYFDLIREKQKLKSQSDTAFLGFSFNVPKRQAGKLLNSKINGKLISEWKDDSLFEDTWNGTEFNRIKVPKRGYFFKFYMPNKMYIIGILNFHYDNDSLTAMRYEIYNWPDLDTVKNFLKSKFGEPLIDTVFIEKYGYKNTTTLFCWLTTTKEIQLVSQDNPHRIWLQYNSIGTAFTREKLFFDDVSYEKEKRAKRIEEARKRNLRIKKQADTILNVF